MLAVSPFLGLCILLYVSLIGWKRALFGMIGGLVIAHVL
jgi:hypothetical protein